MATASDKNVNESTSDGVIVDNKIEGVGESWTVKCLPAESGERDNCNGQLAAGTYRQELHAWWTEKHLPVTAGACICSQRSAAQFATDNLTWSQRPRTVVIAHFAKHWPVMAGTMLVTWILGTCRRSCVIRIVDFSGSARQSPFRILTLLAAATCCMHVLGFADVQEMDYMLQPEAALHACSQWQLWMSVLCKMWNGEMVLCEMDCEMSMQNYGYSANISWNSNIQGSNQIMA